MMTHPTSLSRPIVDLLYEEALLLADEVRSAFSISTNNEASNDYNFTDTDEFMRLALSSEGLKATTRMMHVLAWLLNHRAYLAQEMTDEQLRKYGKLPMDVPPKSKDMLKLEPATRELINETVKLHRRIARLDSAWRSDFEMPPRVHVMHAQLDQALARS